MFVFQIMSFYLTVALHCNEKLLFLKKLILNYRIQNSTIHKKSSLYYLGNLNGIWAHIVRWGVQFQTHAIRLTHSSSDMAAKYPANQSFIFSLTKRVQLYNGTIVQCTRYRRFIQIRVRWPRQISVVLALYWMDFSVLNLKCKYQHPTRQWGSITSVSYNCK